MTLPPPLCHDPLALALSKRGYLVSEIYPLVERCAIHQYDAGMTEREAIIAAVSFCPMELRDE